MKRKIFTFLLVGTLAAGFVNAQEASDFGANDVIIANFEDVNPIVTDSLWTDSLKTTAITAPSANISVLANPDQFINISATAAKYTRPLGGWRSIFIRFNKNIALSKTPYLQMQILPVLDKSPKKTSVNINLINDKGEIVYVGGYQGDIPQDEWTTVTAFLGKQKSSAKYNTIEIQINNGDSVTKIEDTEYYIDQIGFKVPTDGVELPATVFYETFGGWIDAWNAGTVPGQHTYPYDDNGTKKYWGPGEYGTAEAFASVGGFTSGIPFKFRDLAADTVGTFIARCWGMGTKYEGASGNGRTQFRSAIPGTLETGNIDVSGYSNLKLSFGIGTQTWWPYNSEIANARPKVEISVNDGAFYEIYSDSQFLQFTGEQVDLGWGLMDKYEDQVFTLVEYPFTTIEGAVLPSSAKVNLRMTYKSGTDFWVDDLWLAGAYTSSAVISPEKEQFKVYPNPTKDFIVTPNALKVTISDLNGRELINTSNVEKVSVSSLANGIYLVKMVNQEGTVFGKFVKE